MTFRSPASLTASPLVPTKSSWAPSSQEIPDQLPRAVVPWTSVPMKLPATTLLVCGVEGYWLGNPNELNDPRRSDGFHLGP